MTGPFIPLWIIGASFIGILILSFSFKGPSSMSGPGTRSNDPIVDRKGGSTY